MKKRSVIIGGHATSVSLEDEFWDVLKSIAGQNRQSLASLICQIDDRRTTDNLSSALRLAVLAHLKDNQVTHTD